MEVNNMIVSYQKNNASPDEIIKHWDEVFTSNNLINLNFFIFNYKIVQLNFKRQEIDIFLNFLLSKKKIIENKKIGIITTNPRTTCFFIIIESEIYQLLKTEIRVFSTEIAAENWAFSL